MRLVGARRAARRAGKEKLGGTVNYIIGNDPVKWRTEVPTYAGVEYAEVYPGVALVYHGSRRQLEARLVNASGAGLSAAGVPVVATSVVRVSSDSSGSVEEYNDNDPDANFSYQAGAYRFRLKTTGYAPGTYRVTFRAGADPTTHTVECRVRQ